VYYVIGAAVVLLVLIFFVMALIPLFKRASNSGDSDQGSGGDIYSSPKSKIDTLEKNQVLGVDVSKVLPIDLLGLLIFVSLFGANLITYIRPKEKELELTFDILVTSAVFHGIMVLLVLFLIVFRVKPGEFFGLGKASIKTVISYAGLGYLMMLGASLLLGALNYQEELERIFGEIEVQKSVELLQQSSDRQLIGAMVFVACIVAPIAEEVVFRGYIYPVMKRFSGKGFAMVVSSLFFAAIHVNVLSLVPLFLLALILVFVYEKSGSLWTPICLHMIFNTSTVVFQLYAKTSPDLIPA